MRVWLRRVRGVIGTGLTWAFGWAALFGAILLGMAAFSLLEGWDLSYTLRALFLVGGAGFIAGGAFGVLLGILERRKTLNDLSFRRIALWGGLGGLAFAAVLGPQYLGEVIALCLLGIGSATGSVALAKRSFAGELERGGDDLILGHGRQ